MSSREKILEDLDKNRPADSPLPVLPESGVPAGDLVEKFKTVLESIGGTVVSVNHWEDVVPYLNQYFHSEKRWMSLVPELNKVDSTSGFNGDPHQFENVSLTILKGHFGVAENGAVWITDDYMGDRALPFICEHLAVIIYVKDILPTLQDAYDRIGNTNYSFGTFIAGPSKTADIEQSLVLGAHGPKSMTLFVLHQPEHLQVAE